MNHNYIKDVDELFNLIMYFFWTNLVKSNHQSTNLKRHKAREKEWQVNIQKQVYPVYNKYKIENYPRHKKNTPSSKMYQIQSEQFLFEKRALNINRVTIICIFSKRKT